MEKLRYIHKNRNLGIPYPRLANKVKNLMKDYPNDIIEEDNDYRIKKELIPMIIEGIEKRSKYSKIEWEGIKKDYLENKLTYNDLKEKYKVSIKEISQKLKGVKEEWEKKKEEEEKYIRDIIWDKKGIEKKLQDRFLSDNDRKEKNWLGRKYRIRSGEY